MFLQSSLQKCSLLLTLFAMASELSASPIEEGKDHGSWTTTTADTDWTSPLLSSGRPLQTSDSADPTASDLELEIIAFLRDQRGVVNNGGENTNTASTGVPAYTTTLPVVVASQSDDIFRLEKEVSDFLDEKGPKYHTFYFDGSTGVPEEAVESDKIGLSFVKNAPTLDGANKKSSAADSETSVDSLVTTTTTTTKSVTGSTDNNDVISVEPVASLHEPILDPKFVLIIGATASGLLVVLLVVVLVYVCRPKASEKKQKKGMYLNVDCNRWDPQLLRPSQKNIDAFVFGTPIPSVSEMIKYQDDVTSPA